MKQIENLNKQKELEKAIDIAKKSFKKDSYEMSIGEIISLYENYEIVFHEKKMCFKLTPHEKSVLIESILIGYPLPEIFISLDNEERWEVVSGYEYLLTIFDFIGILKQNNKNQYGYERFESITSDLLYLKELCNSTWNDFSRRLQFNFKRQKFNLIILYIQ